MDATERQVGQSSTIAIIAGYYNINMYPRSHFGSQMLWLPLSQASDTQLDAMSCAGTPPKDSGSQADAADTPSEAGSSTALGSRRKRPRAEGQNVGDIILEAEEENMARIRAHLRGKMDVQNLVIHMLEKGSLKPKVKASHDEPTAAPSTNKFQLLSVENWADILSMFDGVHFDKAVLVKIPKHDLCRIGCMVSGIEPGSALVSRKLRVIATFMKRRSSELYGDMYTRVKFKQLENSNEFASYDFDAPGCGTFDVEVSDDKTEGKIIHPGTQQEVPMPKEMLENGGGIVHSNYSEHSAYFKGEYCDPAIFRVFEKAGKTLPMPFFIKKIGDFGVNGELNDDLKHESLIDLTSAAEASDKPAAVDAKARTAAPKTPPAPPAGDGGAAPPLTGPSA